MTKIKIKVKLKLTLSGQLEKAFEPTGCSIDISNVALIELFNPDFLGIVFSILKKAIRY